jgi:hypothetical protein
MPTWDDIDRIAGALPGAERGTSYGNEAWRVRGGAAFVWQRPLRPRDIEELGDAAPRGTVVGVRTPPLLKDALREAEGPAVFATSHFEGFDAVLVHLDEVDPALLEDLVVQSWRDRAPARLRDQLDAR